MTHMHLILALLLLFSPYLAASSFTSPPASTSAGVVERQIEKEYEAKPLEPRKDVPLLEIDLPEDQLYMKSGATIDLKAVEFKGNTLLPDRELMKLTVPYLYRKVTMREIRELCIAIQKLYVKQGYFLARAFPPAQKVQDGVLTLQIVEGSLGKVTVVGNHYYKSSFIAAFFRHLKGKPIQYDEIIKAVMLANDNTDLTVGVVFEKGEEKGTADIIVRVVDRNPVHGYIDYNTYGSHANTYQRTGLKLDYGNLLMNGDTFTAIQVLGLPFDHLQFYDLIYSLPLNHRGTSMSLSYLYSNFQVNRDSSLDPSGRSIIAGINVQQAVIRTKNISANVSFEFDYKQISNLFHNRVVSIDNLRLLLGNFYIDAFDGWRGRNVGTFQLSWGIPDFLASSKPVSPHASREGSGARFVYLNLDYKRIQEITSTQYFVFNFASQYSFNKLPLSEQFYIGGMDTVRGYAMATALGEQGYYGNFEYRFPIPFLKDFKLPNSHRKLSGLVQLVGFLDTGAVYTKGNDPFHEHAPVYLTSTGVGLRIINFYRFNFNFDVGFGLSKAHRPSSSVLYYRLSYTLL